MVKKENKRSVLHHTFPSRTKQTSAITEPYLVPHGNRYFITWDYLNYKKTERMQIFFTLMMIKQIENVKTHNFDSFLPLSFKHFLHLSAKCLYGNLYDFKLFRGNSSQGISLSVRCCKEKTNVVKNYRPSRHCSIGFKSKVSDVCSSFMLSNLVDKYLSEWNSVSVSLSWTRARCIFCQDER